ncbi:MAG TPA: pilus assembly protein TadG-related protein, partial [Candidatus Dormibacteraeota bacterium]|nr:pilus assembly protein TadG-related protein [Candidatus Dormibacteraeota bacterium]
MRNQRGQAIVLIALMLTIVIGMAAIAIDGSRAYALRRDMQAAVDAASLAAGDKLQQTGSWTGAEQAASTSFGTNLHLYAAPSCSALGSPGAAPLTVVCTYSDGTVLTEVAQDVGPQGSQFTLSAQRNLQLQFGRILTNGVSPNIAASSVGDVNNQRYTPAIGALNQSGCSGSGSAITVNGSGTLSVTGDVVANGTVSMTAGAVSVGGDIYAHCQSSVPGSVSSLCYPSGATPPCSYPDVAGATRSGFRLSNPGYPAPAVAGSQSFGSGVVIPPGVYASVSALNGSDCWFLSGGVYEFLSGTNNVSDFVSNELKPPDEPDPGNNTLLSTSQFWNTHGINCAGAFSLVKQTGPRDIALGTWSFLVTSVRSDTFGGVSYTRESAPSMCRQIVLNTHFDDVMISVSNVPGATSYNIYAAPPGNGCAGPFGLAGNLPVSGSVTNSNTSPCPLTTGVGCSLGNEQILLTTQLSAPFAPNSAAAPGTSGAYPPAGEQPALAAGLPNQNPGRSGGASGDRANENSCKSTANAYVTCPGAITPGAVELYYPSGGCLTSGNSSDAYIFSGYQYDWVGVYESSGNVCANTIGASANTAYIGLFYAPSASIAVSSAYVAESPGVGGMIAASFSFTGSLPR